MREVVDPNKLLEKPGPCTVMLVRLCKRERRLSDWD